MTAPDAETLQALHAIDWAETAPRLVLYVQHKMERLTWLGTPGESPVRGIQPGDIVQQAVHDVLCGKRIWNKKKTFMQFLIQDVISSMLSNRVTSVENKKTVRYSSITLSKGYKSRHFFFQVDEIEHFWSKRSNMLADPSSKYIQNRIAFDERRQILEMLSDDSLVGQIAALIIDEDISAPRQLAQRLNTNVNEIYLAKRRLRTRLITFLLPRMRVGRRQRS